MSMILLSDILVPPEAPVENGYVGGWEQAESELGVPLPQDYKTFIDAYGSGQIDEFIWIFNPFSKNENLQLIRQLTIQSAVLSELVALGENVPYSVFPATGGVIPFGITDNGDLLFWKTSEAPSEWTVAVNDSRSPEWQEFRGSMTEFLASLLHGKVRCKFFPEDFPRRRPVFNVSRD